MEENLQKLFQQKGSIMGEQNSQVLGNNQLSIPDTPEQNNHNPYVNNDEEPFLLDDFDQNMMDEGNVAFGNEDSNNHHGGVHHHSGNNSNVH